MAVVTCMVNSFKGEILQEGHHLTSDTLKIALIKSGEGRTYDHTTTNYSELIASTTDEVANGSGYTTGGITLANVALVVDQTNDVAHIDFDDVSWTSATISSSGALIYNTSNSNKAIAVISFGGTVASTAGTFTVQLPAAAHNTSIIRIA